MQNMANNPNYNQQINPNFQINRQVPLRNPNGPFNNFERGSNIFVTSNVKPKEEETIHISKLGVLITNDKINNEIKNEVNFLQHKRLPEQNVNDTINNLQAKKPKID